MRRTLLSCSCSRRHSRSRSGRRCRRQRRPDHGRRHQRVSVRPRHRGHASARREGAQAERGRPAGDRLHGEELRPGEECRPPLRPVPIDARPGDEGCHRGRTFLCPLQACERPDRGRRGREAGLPADRLLVGHVRGRLGAARARGRQGARHRTLRRSHPLVRTCSPPTCTSRASSCCSQTARRSRARRASKRRSPPPTMRGSPSIRSRSKARASSRDR